MEDFEAFKFEKSPLDLSVVNLGEAGDLGVPCVILTGDLFTRPCPWDSPFVPRLRFGDRGGGALRGVYGAFSSSCLEVMETEGRVRGASVVGFGMVFSCSPFENKGVSFDCIETMKKASLKRS